MGKHVWVHNWEKPRLAASERAIAPDLEHVLSIPRPYTIVVPHPPTNRVETRKAAAIEQVLPVVGPPAIHMMLAGLSLSRSREADTVRVFCHCL